MPHHDVTSPSCPDVPGLAWRIASEFRETPGMQLTEAQAQRLWRLDSTTCQQVLTHLVTEHFLRRTAHGRYLQA
jgi:hypothetical protein